MVMACKKEGVMPTTEGALDVKLDLTHAIDGFNGNEHSLPITPLFDDIVQFWSRSGIFYTPTLIVAYGGLGRRTTATRLLRCMATPRSAVSSPTTLSTTAHVDAAYGRAKTNSPSRASLRRTPSSSRLAATCTSAVTASSRASGYHWEMWALASGGASNMEHRAGKLADLVVLNQNPLDDIHNTNTIQFVMKNGELFEGDTLDELYPDEKPLPAIWWWNEKP
jgi:hypothetical protein